MRKTSKTILIIITILTLLFIWVQSALPGEFSSQESGFVMNLIRPFLELFTGRGNVTEHLVRKIAHFTEFAVLGAEAGMIFGVMRRKSMTNIWLALPLAVAACASSAFIDETIQVFSKRGPSITDVWIDIAGGAFGAVIVLLIFFLIEKGRINNEK